jgi:uncharacterized protein (TIGR02231 family)
VQLRYNAQIYNNTGISWHHVPVKISTADPNLTARLPKLDNWEIGRRVNKDIGIYDTVGKINPAADRTQKFQAISVQELAVEFDLGNELLIPSDARPYTVKVTDYQLEASYLYRAVPKVDQDAFLVARVGGWERLNLVDGKASVNYGNTYVGETFISTREGLDSLDISMGRDKQVQIRRVKKEEMSKKQMIGNQRRDSYSFELTVRNPFSVNIRVDVYDQIPVSLDSEVNVEGLMYDGASLDAQTGIVLWELNLAPGASKTMPLAFTIRYPKNKQVTGNTFRTISAPSF